MNALVNPHAMGISDLHLVCGSGGTHAFLIGAGTILACDFAGITNWKSIGGISGGAIIAALYAGGLPAPALVEKVVGFDFATLFLRTGTIYELIRSHLPHRPKNMERRPIREGIMKSAGLGAIIDQHVSRWPANFWTMAVSGKYHILFTADGVFQIYAGQIDRISETPAPLGLAIRASCAVPGILEAIEFAGRFLFDGALSDYGDCPSGIVRQHFGAPAHEIVSCDGSGGMTRQRRAWFALGRLISGRTSQKFLRQSRDEEIFIAPRTNHLGDPLEFNPTREIKEAAVLAGFNSAVGRLAQQGLLTGVRLMQCRDAGRSYSDLHRLIIAGGTQLEFATAASNSN